MPRVVSVDRVLDRDRAADGLDHARECDHKPVAEILHLLPVVGARHVAKQPEVDASQTLGLVIAELGEEGG